jgi:BirA family biotin operon repressor/biotin-[acetyl-CoA-carboxylase] ligase
VAEYRKYSFVLGKEVAFEKAGKLLRGKAVEINQQGELLVLCEDEIITLFSGEISLAEIDGKIYRG